MELPPPSNLLVEDRIEQLYKLTLAQSGNQETARIAVLNTLVGDQGDADLDPKKLPAYSHAHGRI